MTIWTALLTAAVLLGTAVLLLITIRRGRGR